MSEFENFDDKEFPKHEKEFEILGTVIKEIRRRGAKPHYFKHEGSAEALPIVGTEVMSANVDDFGLRLYCVRVNTEIVVLLNGDIKTALDPTKCNNVRAHFKLARQIGSLVDDLILDRQINPLDPRSFTRKKYEL